MQRRPIRPPDLNGSFLTAIKRACREARGRPIRRLRRLPRLWACSRPPSRRPRPPRRWARPPGRAERGFGGFGAPLRMGAGGAAGGAQWCDAGRGKRKRGRTWARNLVPELARAPDSFREARVPENKKKRLFSSTSLLMTRQQIAHPAPPMGPWADPDHPRTCSVLGKYSWQSGTASTAAEEDRSMCR